MIATTNKSFYYIRPYRHYFIIYNAYFTECRGSTHSALNGYATAEEAQAQADKWNREVQERAA